MSAEEAYKKFCAELNKLCERGIISKITKNAFTHIEYINAGALCYKVCETLYSMFEKEEQKSAAYSAMAERSAELVSSLFGGFKGLEKDCAIVCAYISVTQKANASGDNKYFKMLGEHAADYNKSLQSLRYSMPLFS